MHEACTDRTLRFNASAVLRVYQMTRNGTSRETHNPVILGSRYNSFLVWFFTAETAVLSAKATNNSIRYRWNQLALNYYVERVFSTWKFRLAEVRPEIDVSGQGLFLGPSRVVPLSLQ